jgi:amino acid transporter/nucleotide-binding universal stress UspA family protein
MDHPDNGNGNDREKPAALALLASERPRNVNWFQAGSLLFGDWGTSRLYVLGLAFLVAGRSSFWLVGAMSLLIVVVGWAYTHICRLYPDGGGVYTAGRRRARILGVVGALLLFADYTITASLSSVEAFHYFGLGNETHEVESATPAKVAESVAGETPATPAGETASDPAAKAVAPTIASTDPGDHIHIPHKEAAHAQASMWHLRSPGLWAIVAICVIGAFNLMGPKHTAGFAIFAAIGMVLITLLIVIFAIPQIPWTQVNWGRLFAGHEPFELWHGFVYIVLALSGVEAIANLTGVMRKPVFETSRKAIYLVAIEVAVFNLLLAVAMVALATPEIAAAKGWPVLARNAHTEDMLAYMAKVYTSAYIGPIGEWSVRILGGTLLLSATNTAVNGLMSIVYVMSRDGELPGFLQKLNSFGAPWVGAIVAAAVPAIVLLFFHDLQTLAALYAIGVVGAVALDCTLAAMHPRLRKVWRKIAIGGLGLFLIVVWVTLAFTKPQALAFVSIVMLVGLSLRAFTKHYAKRRPKPSLLRRAIMEQLPEDALSRKKILLATAGSDEMAEDALKIAQAEGAALVVTFIRGVALSYKVEAENVFTLDTDPAAQALFTDFLDHGHKYGVPVIPMYDVGTNSPELIAEFAAMNAVDRVLIGSSRRGALHHLLKGSFQRRLESLLPPEIPVQVLTARVADGDPRT